MTQPDGIEPVTAGYSIYPRDGGWRVWCLRTNADATVDENAPAGTTVGTFA